MDSKEEKAQPSSLSDAKGSNSASGSGSGSKGDDDDSNSNDVNNRGERSIKVVRDKKTEATISRRIKWLNFAKSKNVFGFDHLNAVDMPTISPKLRGLSILFSSINKWVPPQALLDMINSKVHNLSIQLSLSMYHLGSTSFFGSTWVGDRVPIEDIKKLKKTSIDIEYNDIAYLMTRITDPSCVLIVEIVANLTNQSDDLLIGQYGCGWSIVDLFNSVDIVDISHERDEIHSNDSPFFKGSPRDLIVSGNFQNIISRFQPIPGASLNFTIFGHSKLLKAQRLFKENELIGKYDLIPGLKLRNVISEDDEDKEPQALPCIGIEELLDKQNNVSYLPAIPSILIPVQQELKNFNVYMPDRDFTEEQLLKVFHKNLDQKQNINDVRILNRVLKVGIHNGHILIGKDWQLVPLLEDREDEELLIGRVADLALSGFVKQENMAIVFALEYTISMPPSAISMLSVESTRASKTYKDQMVTTVSLGYTCYVPGCGAGSVWENLTDDSSKDEDQVVNIELKMSCNEMADILDNRAINIADLVKCHSDEKPKLAKSNALVAKKAVKKSKGKDADSESETDSSSEEEEGITNGPSLVVLPSLRFQFILSTDPMSRRRDSDADSVTGAFSSSQNVRSSKDAFSKSKDFDNNLNDTMRSSKSAAGKKTITVSSKVQMSDDDEDRVAGGQDRDRERDDDDVSVVDSLVGGDSIASMIRYEPPKKFLGSPRRGGDGDDILGGATYSSSSFAKSGGGLAVSTSGVSNLLLKTLNMRLKGSSDLAKSGAIKSIGNESRRKELSEYNESPENTASSSASQFKRAKHIVVEPTVRPLSRAARSRLERHGFDGAFNETKDVNSSSLFGSKSIDLALEAKDNLRISDINIQFAGFCTNESDTVDNRSLKSIYCSYQFYDCKATRTEPMKLLFSESKKHAVLVREEAYARNEPPLVMRYTINRDNTEYESFAFSEYLATHSMMIDVWDSDSLVWLGAAFLPLRSLMRQGKASVSNAFDCDVIDIHDSNHIEPGSQNSISPIIFLEKGTAKGRVVGSLQVIVSHTGLASKNENSKAIENSAFPSAQVDGSNWRSVISGSKSVPHASSNSRAKVTVMATPLSQTNSEITKALEDLRSSVGKNVSTRSLSIARGDPGPLTLTYDEIRLIFKQFHGTAKGTVMYRGPLLSLLHVPSSRSSVVKLSKIIKRIGEKEYSIGLRVYADEGGFITDRNLEEHLNKMFEGFGVPRKPGEIKVLVKFLMKGGKGEKDDNVIHLQELASRVMKEVDRLEWDAISKTIRTGVEDLTTRGRDVEAMLSKHDDDGDGFIVASEMQAFLRELSVHVTINQADQQLVVKHFLDSSGFISLKLLCSFFGLKFKGNMKRVIADFIKRSITEGGSGKIRGSFMKQYGLNEEKTIDEIMVVLSDFHIFKEFTRDSVQSLLIVADGKQTGKLTISKFLQFINLADIIPEENFSVEYLLKMMSDNVKSKGINCLDIFRKFDLNGDNFISPEELTAGLQSLGFLDAIPNWKNMIPKITKRFDISSDGMVSLTEFYKFFGVPSYVPDTIQKLTRIFEAAIEANVSIHAIFEEFDTDKSETLSEEELQSALSKLIGFEHLNKSDIKLIFQQFPGSKASSLSSADGSASVSSVAFITYFEKRVNDYKETERKRVLSGKQNRLRQMFNSTLDKNSWPLKVIFDFFDKNKQGTISTEELANGLTDIFASMSLSKADVDDYVVIIASYATNKDNTVSFDNFKAFMYPLTQGPGSSSSSSSGGGAVEAKKPTPVSGDAELDDDRVWELFVGVMTDISRNSGSPDAFLATLDNDNDGTIYIPDLLARLDKVEFFKNTGVPEARMEKLLMSQGVKGGKSIDRVKVLHILEGKIDTKDGNLLQVSKLKSDMKRGDNYQVADEEDKYEFSKDPEFKALEKKIRNIGKLLSNRGVDVEDVIMRYDRYENGSINRADFVPLLCDLGVSVLEGISAADQGDHNAARMQQLKQMNRIRGDKSYDDTRLKNGLLARIRSSTGADYKDSEFQEQAELMSLIKLHRENQKQETISRVLSHSLSVDITLTPTFGKALFFEFPLTNPFHEETRFQIMIDDPECQVVTDYDHWLILRATCRPCVGDLGPEPVEMEMFDTDMKGIVQVALLREETFRIPFKFMTSNPQSNPRTFNIRIISGAHGHVVSIIKCHIRSQGFVVDRVIRYFEAEQSTITKNILVLPNYSLTHARSSTRGKFIHCVEIDHSSASKSASGAELKNRVLVEWENVESEYDLDVGARGAKKTTSNLDERCSIRLRYKCPKAPEVGTFYILIYNDSYHSDLSERIQVIVNSRQRVDVHGHLGSKCKIEFLLKGDKVSRRVKAYTSNSPTSNKLSNSQLSSLNIVMKPFSVFDLEAGKLNEFTASVRSLSPGARQFIVNVVDVDCKELVSSWIVFAHSNVSESINSHNIVIPKSSDSDDLVQALSKKLVYQNPWNITRQFQLVSSNPSIMQPKDAAVEVGPQGSAYLRLKFYNNSAAAGSVGSVGSSVYLFLIDEQELCEECYLFKLVSS